MSERRMAPSDAVWLYSEFEGNHQAVSAVIWTETQIDPAELRQVVSERLVEKYPTFKQKMRMSRNPLLMPHWQDDPDFDLDNHVHVMQMPAPGDKQALEELVSEQRSKLLDRSRPLWEIFLIQGYQGNTSAVHARIQHAIADGWALVRLVLSLADEDSAAERPRTVDKQRKRKRDIAAGVVAPAKDAVAGAAGAVQHAAARTTSALSDLAADPAGIGGALSGAAEALQGANPIDIDAQQFLEFGQEVPESLRKRVAKVKGAAQTVGGGTKDAVEFLMPPRPGQTILHGTVNGTKKVTWIDPIPLQPIKDAGRTMGATINDVLLGALTNALREYLLAHDALTVDALLTSVPISLRKPDAPLPRTLGNRFGLLPVLLPVGIADPLEQIRDIKRQVDEIKSSQIPLISFGMTSVSAMLTPEVEKFAHKMNQAHSIGITTNVPGPRTELRFAGAKVLGMWGMGGNSGNMNFVFGIFSLNGELNFAVQSDTGITTDPESILDHFLDSVATIQELTLGAASAQVPRPRVQEEESMAAEVGAQRAADAADTVAERLDAAAGFAEAIGRPVEGIPD